MKQHLSINRIAFHGVAVLVFAVLTMFLFSPIFVENKVLNQHDIGQWRASATSLIEYREATGEEGLWADTIFSGMPAYLISISWSTGPVEWIKGMVAMGLPHPVLNIYWAFLSYYILLLLFRINPLFALIGAIAFGLSSYMIVGIQAGHNTRIGSLAFMPLVLAGVHGIFSNRRWLGFGVMTLGLTLHLRENHLQITYYMLFILAAYGLFRLIMSIHEKQLKTCFINTGITLLAVLLAISPMVGSLWSIKEYSQYSTRGPSELTVTASSTSSSSGLDKDYAFAYSNGIFEPMTLLIPNFYGGSSQDYLFQDKNSHTYKALYNLGDPETANQLIRYTSAYWGEQPLTTPYYAGSIVCFLFVLGILFAEKKHVWWLLSVALLGIMITWGDNSKFFSYFMFDYFPGYNKFRSVTFALLIPLFVMPLLGMMGLKKILSSSWNRILLIKKISVALALTGGLCLMAWLVSSGLDMTRQHELSSLPNWLTHALQSDREARFRHDAFRSLIFISLFAVLLFFRLKNSISTTLFGVLFGVLLLADLLPINSRYLTKDNYQHPKNILFEMSEVDKEIKKDTSDYRVYSAIEPWGQQVRSAYFHRSINGYHGAKLQRYQDLYDSCLGPEIQQFINHARSGTFNFDTYGVLNMLNVKYILYGQKKADFIRNPKAGGEAWFIQTLEQVGSPLSELTAVRDLVTSTEAVVDSSQFTLRNPQYDTLSEIVITERTPKYLQYTSHSAVESIAVFSEIYYPKGWHAFVDKKEVSISRVNYVLRALEVPAGQHTIEFKFMPKPYIVGNQIVRVSSWIWLLVIVGSLGMGFRERTLYDKTLVDNIS